MKIRYKLKLTSLTERNSNKGKTRCRSKKEPIRAVRSCSAILKTWLLNWFPVLHVKTNRRKSWSRESRWGELHGYQKVLTYADLSAGCIRCLWPRVAYILDKACNETITTYKSRKNGWLGKRRSGWREIEELISQIWISGKPMIRFGIIFLVISFIFHGTCSCVTSRCSERSRFKTFK